MAAVVRMLQSVRRVQTALYHTDKFSGVLRPIASTSSPEFKVFVTPLSQLQENMVKMEELVVDLHDKIETIKLGKLIPLLHATHVYSQLFILRRRAGGEGTP